MYMYMKGARERQREWGRGGGGGGGEKNRNRETEIQDLTWNHFIVCTNIKSADTGMYISEYHLCLYIHTQTYPNI